mgnify:CR=1 FL=1
MYQPAITGTGVFTPQQVITNEELVVAFNAYADLENDRNAKAIAAGTMDAIPHSDTDFIFKASGIRQRHVIDKTGVLDPHVMHPLLRQRADDELSRVFGPQHDVHALAALVGPDTLPLPSVPPPAV